MDNIKSKLSVVLPYLLCALEEAKKDGKPMIAIGYTKDDGSGRIISKVKDGEEFVHDLCELAGIPVVPTEEQVVEYKARKFLDEFGL